MKKKILFGYNFRRDAFKSLEEEFDVTYPEKEYFNREELLELIPEYDVLVPNFNAKIDKEMIDRGKKLKLIANFGVGYDNIDAAYAGKKGVVVANTPRSVLEPTAELCFGLLLAASRLLVYYDRRLRTPEGMSWKLYDDLGTMVYGKTLGVLGMGRIGRAVARRAVASGMNILYHNRKRDPEADRLFNARYVETEELFSQSDFLTLHAPATSETYHIIDEEAISKMKSSAILVNTARGNLIDDRALLKALREKRIRGAGLDVYENEPRINPGFFELDNVVLLPHAGTKTDESRNDMQQEVADNIRGFFNGGPVSKVPETANGE
jgi:Lactate dehydrogenase and related dehydrogenases